MKLLIITFFSFSIMGNQNIREYRKAIKQYILEYTVFGVDECLKKNIDTIVFDRSELKGNKVLVGSPGYFNMLSTCFENDISTCGGKNCLTKNSMAKRLENIRHIKKLLNKKNKSL
ncbi:MAG: hypothetical protein CME69_09170 [Halobacteriovorax sp.]|nr:hypothetical protein [Halobacteriovorax sp.]|tara:strand:- start:332 stop:679 length:348 start_codon:yes stop_codon:yes gene_type:complete